MADITMCVSDDCPNENTCYRKTAPKNKGQWVADFKQYMVNDQCGHYLYNNKGKEYDSMS